MQRKQIKFNGQFKNFKRASAIISERRVEIPDNKLYSRVNAWEAARDVAQASVSYYVPRNVYCNKTGLFVFTLDAATQSQLYDNPHVMLDTWLDNVCHPAWLNTSPESLRHLQLTMPDAYAIYAYCTMRGLKRDSFQRYLMLDHLRVHWEQSAVCDLAELLRRALALFGNLPSTQELDLELLALPPTDVLSTLREAIAHWITAIQLHHHSQEADRYKTITLSDTRTTQLAYGSLLFQTARITDDPDGYGSHLELMDIFGELSARDMRLALSFNKKKSKASQAEENLARIFNLGADTLTLDDMARDVPAVPTTKPQILTRPEQFTAAALFGGVKHIEPAIDAPIHALLELDMESLTDEQLEELTRPGIDAALLDWPNDSLVPYTDETQMCEIIVSDNFVSYETLRDEQIAAETASNEFANED